jgi:MFS family permease
LIALGGFIYLRKLVLPPNSPRLTQEVALVADAPKRERIVYTPAMKRMIVVSAVYQFGIAFYGGVSSVHYVQNLKASDFWIGLVATSTAIGSIIGYLLWERYLRKHSMGSALRIASLLTWTFPVGLALLTNMPLIILVNGFVNLMHPGNDLDITNIILQLPREQDRAAFTSRYIAVVSFCALVGPLLGVWLSDHIAWGIPGVIFMSGVFRLIGGVLYNLFPVTNKAA